MNICHLIESRISLALQALGLPETVSPMVTRSTRPEFGDYQVNGIISAAKELGQSPNQLATSVLNQVDMRDFAEQVDVAGPGFINIRLGVPWLEEQCTLAAMDMRLGIKEATNPQTIVVDYSGPNLAKEMHVGHLRSTIIGDAQVRVLSFLGHQVILQNHVGDWGTQFGMLIEQMLDLPSQEGGDSTDLSGLESLYNRAKTRFDEDPGFASAARQGVTRLQSGDPEYLRRWQILVDISVNHIEEVYERLGVNLSRTSLKPESSYNSDLPTIVSILQRSGLVTKSNGAQCAFQDEFKDQDGNLIPLIVEKSDGGYTYATTDLAAVRYRSDELDADRILYFADSRQDLHFQQVFALARKAKLVKPQIILEHCAFGTMLGDNEKPIKTREGDTTKLIDLLDEAERRAFDLVSRKKPELSEEQRRDIGHKIGIGAVKYSELSKNRLTDYAFSFESMLSLDGHTAPYLQYACARIRGIFRAIGNENLSDRAPSVRMRQRFRILIAEPAERSLAVKLLQFTEFVEKMAIDSFPSQLCAYLFELTHSFMNFYERCPIVRSDVGSQVRDSRLTLAYLTLRTLTTGLDLLGVEVPESM